MRASFYAPVRDRHDLQRFKFYADDIRILKELGYDVTVATKWRQISWETNLLFIWWWTWAFAPVLLARLHRIPVLITGAFDYHRSSDPLKKITYFSDRPFWQRFLITVSLRYSNGNIFVSSKEHNLLTEDFKLANAYYIPHGIDVDFYTPSLEPKESYLLNVAWCSPRNAIRKGLPELIRAFALIVEENPGIKLVMAGKQGTYNTHLVKLCHELGVENSVEFKGVISEEKKRMLMQHCLAYVQPSRYEGFGLAIAEAMACGACVVVTDVGEVREVVGDSGIYANSVDPVDIASAIDKVIKNKELRRSLASSARSRIQSLYSLSRRREGISEVITRISARR